MRGNATLESTHDRMAASSSLWIGVFTSEYIGREVACMTDYEIIMIFLGILALLVSFGGLLIALLNFLDKRNSRRK